MRLLLYCIFDTVEYQKRDPLSGVGGQPVFMVSSDGLSAAVSRVSLEDLTPTVSRALAYGKVIETFHGASTVIPMRYGSQFEHESGVIQFLAERTQECKALLRKLSGCVEMGIRILPRDTEAGNEDGEAVLSQCIPDVLRSTNPGRLYMAARRTHYAQQEGLAEESRALTQRCRGAFAGLFVECKMENFSFGAGTLALRAPLVSLHFLVRRTGVESFRRTFRQIKLKESARLLLSGPWPAYNFVDSVGSKIVTGLGRGIENE